jgi:N-acyl-D-amino-acid deacylase
VVSGLEQTGIGLNLASLAGHNTIRREVMGTANRLATPEEIAKMQALVEKNMRDGAVGFSTGLIYIPARIPMATKWSRWRALPPIRRRLFQPHARRGLACAGRHRGSDPRWPRRQHARRIVALQDR